MQSKLINNDIIGFLRMMTGVHLHLMYLDMDKQIAIQDLGVFAETRQIIMHLSKKSYCQFYIKRQ